MGIINIQKPSLVPGYVNNPRPHAKAYVFHTGRKDQLATLYEDANLTRTLANPISADDTGQFPVIYVIDNVYDLELNDRNESPILTISGLAAFQTETRVIRAMFLNVGELLLDSTLSYEGNTPVVPGDVVQVQIGSFNYLVLAPDEDDFHLQTTGGIKLLLRGFPEGLPRAFGAIGNGEADDTAAVQAAIDYAFTFSPLEGVDYVVGDGQGGPVFNGGASASMASLDLGGLTYAVSDEITMPDGGGDGGAGGAFSIENGGLKALPNFPAGKAVLRASSANSFDWTQSISIVGVQIDANNSAAVGIKVLKSVGTVIDRCHVTRYTEIGVETGSLAYNVEVQSSYIEAFPYGTGGTPAETRTNAPEYGCTSETLTANWSTRSSSATFTAAVWRPRPVCKATISTATHGR